MKTYQELQRELLGIWESAECECNDIQATARVIKGGSIRYTYQCIVCGRKHGDLRKEETAALDKHRVPFFDENKNSVFIKNAQSRNADYRDQQSKKWWAEYSDYLTSLEWRKKRTLVLERSKGICEGCLQNKATQIHHLNYNHQGDELLFELVALCDDCHNKVHGKS